MTQYPTSLLWAPVRRSGAMTPAYVPLLHSPFTLASWSSIVPLYSCFLKLLTNRRYSLNWAVCHQRPTAPLSFPQCFGGQWHVTRTSVNSDQFRIMATATPAGNAWNRQMTTSHVWVLLYCYADMRHLKARKGVTVAVRETAVLKKIFFLFLFPYARFDEFALKCLNLLLLYTFTTFQKRIISNNSSYEFLVLTSILHPKHMINL